MVLLPILVLILLHAAGTTSAGPSRSSRWWFNLHSDAFTDQAVALVDAHRDALTGVYAYFGVSVDGLGEVHFPPESEMRALVSPFLQRNLTVGIALVIDEGVVQRRSWTDDTVQSLAAQAKAAGLHSLMLDYEPNDNITRAHAVAYADFVRAITSAMHARGLEMGMCVSSWGILDNFTLYAATGVDSMMTMAATYFGSNVTADEGWVSKEMQDGVSQSQLRAGIGTTNAIYEKWNYNWTEARFAQFFAFLEKQDVRGIDLWRTDIDSLNATNGTASWIYDALSSWLSPELS